MLPRKGNSLTGFKQGIYIYRMSEENKRPTMVYYHKHDYSKYVDPTHLILGHRYESKGAEERARNRSTILPSKVQAPGVDIRLSNGLTLKKIFIPQADLEWVVKHLILAREFVEDDYPEDSTGADWGVTDEDFDQAMASIPVATEEEEDELLSETDDGLCELTPVEDPEPKPVLRKRKPAKRRAPYTHNPELQQATPEDYDR